MLEPDSKTYIYENKEAPGKVLQSINGPLRAVPAEGEEKRITFYDTFDWRLYKRNLVLVHEQNTLALVDFRTLREKAAAPWKRKHAPRFHNQLREGSLRHLLGTIAGIRALLPLASVTLTTGNWNVLNEDDKTVVRVSADKSELWQNDAAAALPQMLTIRGLRGYEAEFIRACSLADLEGLLPAEQPFYITVLQAAGHQPKERLNRKPLKLRQRWPADKAVRETLLSFLAEVKENENGVLADYDTEFLHDFRVAIRKTRSVLSLVKQVLPPAETTMFKERLSALARISNPVRDYDVYLLRKDEYKQYLPEYLQDGLEVFFADAEAERKKAFAALRRHLRSKKYNTLLEEWEEFLRSAPPEDTAATKRASMPVKQLGCRLITKKFRQVVEYGAIIIRERNEARLHKLRIECKKLRYLLEIFATLFPKKTIKELVSHLKGLQNILGDFNDYDVQEAKLRKYLEEAESRGVPEHTVAAVGGVMAIIHGKKIDAINMVEDAFAEFSKPENIALTYELCPESKKKTKGKKA